MTTQKTLSNGDMHSTKSFTLENGVIYRVSTPIYYAGMATVSPISVPEHSSAVIYIERDVTVDLSGGNAIGTDGAAPAISVAPNAVLYVVGEENAVLKVSGGRPANGVNGSCPPNAPGYDSNEYWCGSRGSGGNGGGGGAPAIGNHGGSGGKGAVGDTKWKSVSDHGTWTDVEKDERFRNAPAGCLGGVSGGDGGVGGSCGTVVFLGNGFRVDLSVDPTVSKGGAGKSSSNSGNIKLGVCYGNMDHYTFGSGGCGGGGGGGSVAPYCIGGGGGGGGGGGAGGAGVGCCFDKIPGLYDRDDLKEKDKQPPEVHCCGGGGLGGGSRNAKSWGAKGETCWCGSHMVSKFERDSKKDGDYHPTRMPMGGGAGGVYGDDGQMTGLFCSPHVTLESVQKGMSVAQKRQSLDQMPAEVREAVRYSITFVDTSESSVVFDDVLLGGSFPEPDRPPERTGFVFKGYYSERYGGGTQYYDAEGKLKVPDCYAEFGDLTLYACWGVEGASDSRTVRAGERYVYDGLFDGAALVQPKGKRLLTVERGGEIVLRNVTLYGSDEGGTGLIFNEGTLYASNCVFREAYSPDGWGGVYADRPGAKAVFYACTFRDNAALDSAAIAAEGSDVSAVHCTFLDNQAFFAHDREEVAAAVSGFDGARLNLVSCTFYGNESPNTNSHGCAALAELTNRDRSQVANCIFCRPAASVLTWGLRGAADVTVRNNVETNDASAVLGRRRTRTIDGVDQVSYKPMGIARQTGVEGLVYRSDDWEDFAFGAATDVCTTPIEADQLRQHPISLWAGAHNGNTLQYLIDIAAEGDTIEVGAGLYDAVIVDKTVHIVGTNAEDCVLDADAVEPCVIVGSGGVSASWANFTFRNGYGGESDGGGWQGPPGGGGSVSNCVFRECSATNGGAIACARLVSDSLVTGCSAQGVGGGTYGCTLVERTIYTGNTATRGGASANDEAVQSSFLRSNTASDKGGAASGSTLRNCTLADNKATTAAGGASLIGCLLYNNAKPTDSADGRLYDTFEVRADAFVNAAGGNFHLAAVKIDQDGVRTTVDRPELKVDEPWSYVLKVRDTPLLDIEGFPLVNFHPADTNLMYLYAGCYAFVPFKTHGLTVTGPDEWYDNEPMKTSLREAVEEARRFPVYAKDGEFRITFDPEAFASGTATIPFSEPQIAVDVFTNATLVIAGPTNCAVVIDGHERYRAFHVQSGNALRTENLTFCRCRGSTEGVLSQSTDGGAIRNDGMLFVTNCAFLANSAGSRTGEYLSQVGYGGAIATGDGATSRIWRATFVANMAAGGGALYTGAKARNDVFFSTFSENGLFNYTGAGLNNGGGAISAVTTKSSAGETLLVNCTVVSNWVDAVKEKGGGIYAGKGLTLVNSVVVGNLSGGETNDLKIVGYMGGDVTNDFVCTVYGTRSPETKSANSPHYADVDSVGGYTADQLFAYGSAQPAQQLANDPHVSQVGLDWTRFGAVHHYVLPFLSFGPESKITLPATNVWISQGGVNVGYGSDRKPTVALRGTLMKLSTNKTLVRAEQLGMSFDACLLGATKVTAVKAAPEEERGAEDDPDDPDDPGGDEPDVKAVAEIIRRDGTTQLCASLDELWENYRPSDAVRIVDENDEETWSAVWEVFEAFETTHEWYDFEMSEDALVFSLALNDLAVPVLQDFDLVAAGQSGARVEIRPEQIVCRRDLWYALGYSSEVTGPFTPGEWVQADGEGLLKRALQAPATGTQGFYRIFVTSYPDNK